MKRKIRVACFTPLTMAYYLALERGAVRQAKPGRKVEGIRKPGI